MLVRREQLSTRWKDKIEQPMVCIRSLKSAMLLGIVLTLALPAHGPDAAEEVCTGPYKGQKVDQEDLQKVLTAHRRWLETAGKEGTQANLCGARLLKRQLEGVDLRQANLAGAKLIKATITNAKLNQANLVGANLTHAKLTKTVFEKANLAGARLNHAKLQAADLSAAVLHRAKLHWADLSGADLIKAQLNNAALNDAILTKVKLNLANLTGADLTDVDLTDANLSDAILENATLERTNLTRAQLSGAILENATLKKTNLTQAQLPGVKIAGAIFEPQPGSLKEADLFFRKDNKLDKFRGLNRLQYEESPHGLTELRETYKNLGMRMEERAVNYALRHQGTSSGMESPHLLKKIEASLTYFLLEFTCGYGLYPLYPLHLLMYLIVFFTVPYTIALIWSTRRRAWIWLVWQDDRIRQDEGDEKPIPVTPAFLFAFFLPKTPLFPMLQWRGLRLVKAPIIGLYFSLLSAFHVGWQDFDVGAWIRRIQPREYTLRASGWVRSVVGLQALISIYLLALWALTYFGGPLE